MFAFKYSCSFIYIHDVTFIKRYICGYTDIYAGKDFAQFSPRNGIQLDMDVTTKCNFIIIF